MEDIPILSTASTTTPSPSSIDTIKLGFSTLPRMSIKLSLPTHEVVKKLDLESPASPCIDSYTGSFVHRNPNHANIAFSTLNKMRENNQLCDVTVKVGNTLTSAHKAILAAISPYFQAMFNDDLVEKTQTTVTLHDIDAEAVQNLVTYAYTGEITITEDNVQALLPASSVLQISIVRDACCKFLLKQLHPSNCLGIKNFADTHSCKELQTRSHNYALHNFCEVVNAEEFLALSLEEVEELLGSSNLNVATEEDTYYAALAWVKHDMDQRTQYLAELLSKIRLPLLSRQFLMTVVDTEILIKSDPGCKELLLEAMRYHLCPEKRNSLASDRTRDRKPDGTRPYVFAVGGGSLFAIHNECECYNPRTGTTRMVIANGTFYRKRYVPPVILRILNFTPLDQWVSVAPLLTRRSRCGLGKIGSMLYVVGGYDGTSDLSTAEFYSPRTNKWTYAAPMGTRRSCLGVCSLDGLLYTAGGYDGASCLNSVERYDPLTNCWTNCPALTQRRRYCRLVSCVSCIWAVGGMDSTTSLASVERMDPREGKWSSMPALTHRRSSAGLAVLDGNLFCTGGSDGSNCLATSEKFDPRRLRWETIISMNSRRSTHELVSLDIEEPYLLALGGNDGSSSLSTVEKYEPRLNKWTNIKAMITRRSSLGAAVLDCLPLESHCR